MPFKLQRFIWPAVFLLLGSIAAYYGCSAESHAVQEQMIGYPNSDLKAHSLRPWLLGLLCFLPFITSLAYSLSGTLDRYTMRQFLTAFSICFGALFSLMMLEDLQDNVSDFKESSDAAALMAKHYLVKLPSLIVFILPYSLMLSLLWCLGKMSRSQEIVSMIQTGRGVTRIVAPLIGFGVLAAVICIIFNYHWAPYADGQERTILQAAKGDITAEANNVAYQNHSNTRQWFVGSFPYRHSDGAPLEDISITEIDEDNHIIRRIHASTATWSRQDKTWTLVNPVIYDLTVSPMPTIKKLEEPMITKWKETPWQIIKPGLKPPYLGIPGLNSWLANHQEHPLSDKRSYLTHWHYRFAQPFICLITILLAAPLGIVFTRRGIGGGIAVAIFLCAGMIFCSTVFPTLGESGHLSPFWAAWATNILFTCVALVLFYRRMTGQPIYQAVMNFLASER
ncbi:Predicted permease YjgP/YjgQ family protein [Rubritalea squalenifaciens DSM 18772]|uniref:Predicted permease YjgP/YjgQ family protein n=1 Tax=Rubritalea squalenifaciens DSM 18772 TaxID=1123071 RepID=A0A1M6E8E6_9BACT|nr:LptF/LptG family permease [Rubritalea squalenifaciens]SHI81693.1 Predicted permease YjgP/YjgQ family protein [Rubritalea squalenifaciens DSM 18772]